ncbi:helix-turn-helix domain-containing protein [Clostridium sp. HBUAS56010]|uniref:helix-turn-helix domain-containing protein n=1 Tax=Clostridium sp. HBUAS56010 TaxID=2571127 RepID=UPI0011784A82|nr:helix-turn-helix domain-containing protein [Clostridium sp. HBUAS56010]
MGMKYYKLFDQLNRRGIKKTDLLSIISSPTLAKLSDGKTITTDTLCKICAYLDLQPGEIMEYIDERDS